MDVLDSEAKSAACKLEKCPTESNLLSLFVAGHCRPSPSRCSRDIIGSDVHERIEDNRLTERLPDIAERHSDWDVDWDWF